MPDPEQTPGPRKQDLVRRLARPALALAGVIVFQLLFASVFARVLHHPVLHQAPVADAGRSPLLASPWNVIGQGLPPSAALSAARRVVYIGGANPIGPQAVLATYPAAGTVLTLAATAWRRHRPASRAPQHAAQAAGASLAA